MLRLPNDSLAATLILERIIWPVVICTVFRSFYIEKVVADEQAASVCQIL